MKEVGVEIMDIYPKMLTDAYSLCEAILTEDYGYTENQFFKEFILRMEKRGYADLSNQIVRCMFDVTEGMIKDKDEDAEVDYYINGSLNTHFYINGEQQ